MSNLEIMEALMDQAALWVTSPPVPDINRVTRKLNDAYKLADWHREGGIAWVVVMDNLVAKGFYGVTRRGRYVAAYLDGVRFEL